MRKFETALSKEDQKSLKLVEEAWKDIEKGRYRAQTKKSFLEELREW